MQTVIFGVVTDTNDPDSLGRVEVSLPDYSGDIKLPWVRVAQPYASKEFGAFLLPEVDDQVVIVQGPGGISGMVVVGVLYSGTRAPKNPDDGSNNLKQIITRGGNEITLDDTDGSEKITIKNAEGDVQIELDASGTKLTLTGKSEVTVSSDTKVVVDAKDVEVTAGQNVTIEGSQNVEITGTSGVTVKGTSTLTMEGGSVEIKGTGSVSVSAPSISLG